MTDSAEELPHFDLSQIALIPGLASLEYQPETPSTSDWAMQLARDDARRWPLLVLTSRQTLGRGRGANRWWSAAGALTFSLVIDAREARLSLEQWPMVALATGLAVCEATESLCPAIRPALKWPNDVYVDGRKLCGILVEAPSSAVGRIVIGVGVNVNNSFAAAPGELRENVASLSDAAGGSFDLTETLCLLVERIVHRVASLSVDAERLPSEFSRYCLLTGRTVEIEAGQQRVIGQCLGLDATGALLLHTAEGARTIHAGRVVRWS